MESDKTQERKVIAPDFGKHPKLALQLLEDEKRMRKKIRKRAEKGIKVVIPKEIDDAIKEVEEAV